jgi:hypothetical protein
MIMSPSFYSPNLKEVEMYSVVSEKPLATLRRSLLQCLSFILLGSLLFPAAAQNSQAEVAAQRFVNHLESVKASDIYDDELGPTFKQAIKKDAFVSGMGMLKIQSGGGSLARQLVGGQSFKQTPTGQTGDFYYVRFKTKFPVGMVFQDVYLEKVDSDWKVSGYWTFPAPSN